jgi:integrase
MLGALTTVDDNTVRASWTDSNGATLTKEFVDKRDAVMHIAKPSVPGPRFHDLRHSYATWLGDDGVPVNMVQRVMGHERSSTTLDLYTRRTDDHSRILQLSLVK